ncbi:serine protease [Acinetobacter baumannii]|uniref:S1 family peptidase n=1 Tax=Acinetobacter baumannii TaxID=470 RepID=UPI000F74B346|nr:serine protease [Acinetobacter baumannii]RSP91914.1 serine protease [Acinetobacter baumannii]
MNSELTLAESLLYSTVKITSTLRGQTIGAGTGFYTSFRKTSEYIAPMLITNKHVIENADSIFIQCHIKHPNHNRPSGKLIRVSLSLNDKVFNHPDSNVDLCAIPLIDLINQTNNDGNIIFVSPIHMSWIPDESDWEYFDAIEEVTMIGCPNGLFDSVNNLPLIRQGVTATSPNKPYNGKQEFMVDMACFPGSSGSPILLYNPSGYFDKRTGSYFFGKTRLKLIGVLYAGPQISNTGQIILNKGPQFEISSMMHLGIAIRSSELKKLEDLYVSTF